MGHAHDLCRYGNTHHIFQRHRDKKQKQVGDSLYETDDPEIADQVIVNIFQ
jgi:hypothetical protein